MKVAPRHLLAAAVLAAMPMVVGCVVRPAPGPYVEADAGPGPVVYDDYYYSGYYDGPVYYWHDRYGHLRHEDRGMHERRELSAHRGHAEERRGARHQSRA